MLVLDANILVLSVLGRRVRSLLAAYGGSARFLAPDAVVSDAREHLPAMTWTTEGVEIYLRSLQAAKAAKA